MTFVRDADNILVQSKLQEEMMVRSYSLAAAAVGNKCDSACDIKTRIKALASENMLV
jgi:hypothetical protein